MQLDPICSDYRQAVRELSANVYPVPRGLGAGKRYVSSTALLNSISAFWGGASLKRARTRSMTSAARLPALTMETRTCCASCRLGGCALSQLDPACAPAMAAAIAKMMEDRVVRRDPRERGAGNVLGDYFLPQ